ncbi:hypothetical protein SESBI_51357, partial [Sesbania bispinosa]
MDAASTTSGGGSTSRRECGSKTDTPCWTLKCSGPPLVLWETRQHFGRAYLVDTEHDEYYTVSPPSFRP